MGRGISQGRVGGRAGGDPGRSSPGEAQPGLAWSRELSSRGMRCASEREGPGCQGLLRAATGSVGSACLSAPGPATPSRQPVAPGLVHGASGGWGRAEELHAQTLQPGPGAELSLTPVGKPLALTGPLTEAPVAALGPRSDRASPGPAQPSPSAGHAVPFPTWAGQGGDPQGCSIAGNSGNHPSGDGGVSGPCSPWPGGPDGAQPQRLLLMRTRFLILESVTRQGSARSAGVPRLLGVTGNKAAGCIWGTAVRCPANGPWVTLGCWEGAGAQL